MKYGDLLLVFLGIISILSVGYTFGVVDGEIWYVPVILFTSFFIMYYKLKIEK